jgi:hypothetical protein
MNYQELLEHFKYMQDRMIAEYNLAEKQGDDNRASFYRAKAQTWETAWSLLDQANENATKCPC